MIINPVLRDRSQPFDDATLQLFSGISFQARMASFFMSLIRLKVIRLAPMVWHTTDLLLSRVSPATLKTTGQVRSRGAVSGAVSSGSLWLFIGLSIKRPVPQEAHTGPGE